MKFIRQRVDGKVYGYFALIVFLLASNISIAQVQLGNMSYGHVPTPNLARTVSMGASFFRGVGGVAFEAIATGEDGLIVSNLTYNPKIVDGKRLEVTLKNKQGKTITVNADIYDWQFIPVAKFANSIYGAAMTLFGDASDEKVGKEILSAGGRVINYHSSFKDTLVGLRLFHTDILIFQPNAADLFKTSSGDYILGAGEKGHDLKANNMRFEKMTRLLNEERSKGNTFASFVVGDLGQKITFKVSNNSLTFTGSPYWWMWDNPAQRNKDFEIVDALRVQYELEEKYANSSTMSLIDRFSYMEVQPIVDAFFANDGDSGALVKRMTSYESSNAEVTSNPAFSRSISKKVEQLKGINPIVYATLKKVMHYSALFRHAKQQSVEKYIAFLASIRNVKISPKVETPTVQYGVVH